MAAKFFFIEQFQVFYYSGSSDPQEAAYINLFDSKNKQVGSIRFLYDNIPLRANVLEPSAGAVIYYHHNRFENVINLLLHAKQGAQSIQISFDEANKVFALCNNLYVPVGNK